jgi:ADP-ribose pyrophosphatase YjhB (NUDIX family)
MPQLEVATIVMKDASGVLIGRAASGADAGKWAIPSGFVNDGERIIDASSRIIREQTGLVVLPKQVLFLSEIVEPGDHRVAVFAFGECASSGDPKPDGTNLTEARFVDPRELKQYQDQGMARLSEDAFYKFSFILKAQSQAQPMPRSGTVN